MHVFFFAFDSRVRCRFVASPELMLSCPIGNDCENFRVEVYGDSCVSVSSVGSSSALASCDIVMCGEGLHWWRENS